MGSVYFWIPFHIFTLSPPPCSTQSACVCVFLSLRLFCSVSSLPSLSDRHCRSLDSEASLQWLTLIKVANESPFHSVGVRLCVCVCVPFNVCVSASVFLCSERVHKAVTHLGWVCEERKAQLWVLSSWGVCVFNGIVHKQICVFVCVCVCVLLVYSAHETH